MDKLSPLFARLDIHTQVFYSGVFCGKNDFDGADGAGHLHILKSGVLRVSGASGQTVVIDEPSVIFYPQPCRHRLQSGDLDRAELVCATIESGAPLGNSFFRTLPEMQIIPLNSIAGLEAGLALLFAEAFDRRSGRQAAMDCLAKFFLILLLRHVVETLQVDGGILAGLADEKLAKAITAMHEQPGHAWSLEKLAQTSGMSRARFAVKFRETVGVTPLDYLTDWRISVAQNLLARGKPLKVVAPEVGYANPTALTRVFCKRLGTPPMKWLARTKEANQRNRPE